MMKTILVILLQLVVSFTFAQTSSLSSFTLVNADNDQDIQEIDPGMAPVLNLATLPSRNLNIRANTNPSVVGSVKFVLTGPNSRTFTENAAPYALYADNKGNYYAWTPALGTYTLKATPYSSNNAKGTAGTSLTVTFTIINQPTGNMLPVAHAGADQTITLPTSSLVLQGSGSDADGTISAYAWSQVSGPNSASFSSSTVARPTVSGLIAGTYAFSLVVRDNLNAQSAADQVLVSVQEASPAIALASFTLVNADNEQDIQVIDPTTASVLNLATLPSRNLNIRANTNPSLVGSVKFVLTGPNSRTHTENAAPYALYADNSGNYNSWMPALGTYTLTGTPYPSGSGGGTAGTGLTVSFTVTDQPTGNVLPIANAGLDQVINLPESSTVLEGSGSDADGAISAYAWSQVSGPNSASFSSSTVAMPTVSGLIAGSYVFSLIVRDNLNVQSVADQVVVTVIDTGPPVISGELKKWHKVGITFSGPATNENDTRNPFLDYRLTVTFSNGSQQIQVPGFYAADGNAGETGAVAGNKWRVYFCPNETGTWTYTASFRTSTGIAIDPSPTAGSALAFDGLSGSFDVGASDKTGPDFRAKGRLRYTGQHYLQFAETQEYFLKGGADSPENFLAYQEFDATYRQYNQFPNTTKTYTPHIGDWQSGDPTWMGGKGKGIIGALNYLAGKGMNSVYFLTMNINGDGQDVWPWTQPTERLRYDVSKLDQWELVFSHMDRLGMMLHVVTQETENDQLLDGGDLGVQRKLYYRELIARFGHHLAIAWNLGEENTNTEAQRKAFADYIRQLDPYRSFITIHNEPSQLSSMLTSLLGYPSVEGPSLQMYSVGVVHQETLKWLGQSAANGHKWVVNLDEIGPSNDGVVPDNVDYEHALVRKQALWGNLMAGGGGVEWYFGYNHPHNDLTAEDWRSRDHMWDLTRYALEFFRQYLPFWLMQNTNSLTASTTDYCLSLPGQTYAIYLPDGETTTLNIGPESKVYQVKWYNPRTGGALQEGSITQISGTGIQALGEPPTDATQDWVCLVTSTSPAPGLRAAPGMSAGQPVPNHKKTVGRNQARELPPRSLSVNPNPIRSEARVQVDLPQEGEGVVEITDLQGKPVLRETRIRGGNSLNRLDLAWLKPGVYLIQVKYKGSLLRKRIVKF